MPGIGKYIYGIIRGQGMTRAGLSGSTLENAGPEQSCAGRGAGACERPYIIPYKDIAAVASDSEMVEYHLLPKTVLGGLLVRHQKVVEDVMGSGTTVIPMRLGTFAATESEVERILGRGYKLIKEIMEKIDDKIETDVVATWNDFGSVLKEVGEEKEIAEFKKTLLAKPEGVTQQDQMKVGMMLKKCLDNRRDKYASRIRAVLGTVSEDMKVHELMDDKMIVNCACLVSKSGIGVFDRKLEELNANFNDKVHFKSVGPLPPYSFYTLDLKRMRFEDVDWARRKLRVGEFATRKDIKKAFQKAAVSSHPDKNPGSAGAEKEFDDVARAYETLVDYCCAFEQSGRGDGCRFEREAFGKNAILVKVREQQ